MALPVAPSLGAAPAALSQGFDMPPPSMPQMGGMFGGGPSWQNALMAAVAGFNARRNPGFANSMMEQLTQKQVLNRQAQLAMMRDQMEFQRQIALAQQAAELKLQYPDSPLAQSLYQAGVMPGTPQWTQAMQKDVDLKQNPVVNAGPYGPVLYSQVANASSAKPLTDADIAAMDSKGGQTAAAPSGGFLGSGSFSDIGPYHRY